MSMTNTSCIAVRIEPPLVYPDWYRRWRLTLDAVPAGLTDGEQEAFARVLPLLWCGEQSAISVFRSEAERLNADAWRESVRRFNSIAAEETLHEDGLRALSERLPQPADIARIRRRARLFFLRLGRTRTVAAHFGQIAHLDRAVCVIVHRLERAPLGRSGCLGSLLRQIKRDEARHVAISRRHAFALGLGRDAYGEQGAEVRAGLLDLLAGVGDACETLGLDLDRLSRRLGRLS